MRFAFRITKVTDTHTHTHTHSIFNTNCFSTTNGYRTRLSVFVTRTVLVLLLLASFATIVGFAVYVGNFSCKIAKQ